MMKKNILRVFIERFDYYLPGITADALHELNDDTIDTYLLEKADQLFSDGRYSDKTEMTLEFLDRDDYQLACHDLKCINDLTDDERTRYDFYLRLSDFAYPLFKRRPVSLTASPLKLQKADFNIKNKELRTFLYDSPYMYLSMVIAKALIRVYWGDEKLRDTVLLNESSNYLASATYEFYDKGREEAREALDHLVDRIWEMDNHLEVGRRMGFSPLAQALYDMFDTYLSTVYDYRQVDMCKEMASWIGKHWPYRFHTRSYDPNLPHRHDFAAIKAHWTALEEEMDACVARHELSYVNRWETMLYIECDLLCVPSPTRDELSDEDREEM